MQLRASDFIELRGRLGDIGRAIVMQNSLVTLPVATDIYRFRYPFDVDATVAFAELNA
jgi:hypothetical protein